MVIHLLLADDHTIVREGLRMILESQPDFTVVGEASNGREAVRLTEQLHPDVVIMEVVMSELNGIDAARKILEQDSNIKIIILSMHLSSEFVMRALQAGALGYLLKTSASAELIAAVREVIRGHRYLDQRVTESFVEDLVLRNQEGYNSPLERLSTREREILQLIAEGKSSAVIADLLSLSPSTVDTYRGRLMQKLGLTDLAGIIKFAIRHGLTSVD